MRERYEDFQRAGARLLVIGIGTPDDLSKFMEGRSLPFEVVCDPDQSAYSAYGLQRGNLWQVALAPQVVAAGIEARIEGHKIEGIVQDAMQLPGSFVIRDGRLIYIHRGQMSSDIADPDELLKALEA